VFLAKKQEKTILRVLIVSLLMLLTLNLWLIPLAGQVGAGWAVLITEIAQAVLFSLAWMKSLLRRNEALHSKGVLHELSDPSR
jgi:O-antigen/teichoic acid export membrane protein